tara:strand:- start:77 stop:400 length:324 start_codon:yes stop_codon:yes gene_type:complete
MRLFALTVLGLIVLSASCGQGNGWTQELITKYTNYCQETGLPLQNSGQSQTPPEYCDKVMACIVPRISASEYQYQESLWIKTGDSPQGIATLIHKCSNVAQNIKQGN